MEEASKSLSQRIEEVEILLDVVKGRKEDVKEEVVVGEEVGVDQKEEVVEALGQDVKEDKGEETTQMRDENHE